MMMCILLPILIFGNNSESDILVKYDEYSYRDSSCNLYTITEYIINNDSEDNTYVTFVYPYEAGQDLEKTIKRYFLSHHKDFNLMTILTDNIVLNDFVPIIGKTFLKDINPNEEFKYIEVESAEKQYIEDSNRCIFVVEKNYIENLLNLSFIDDIFFQKDELVILFPTSSPNNGY